VVFPMHFCELDIFWLCWSSWSAWSARWSAWNDVVWSQSVTWDSEQLNGALNCSPQNITWMREIEWTHWKIVGD
jgi:hypothetical protein